MISQTTKAKLFKTLRWDGTKMLRPRMFLRPRHLCIFLFKLFKVWFHVLINLYVIQWWTSWSSGFHTEREPVDITNCWRHSLTHSNCSRTEHMEELKSSETDQIKEKCKKIQLNKDFVMKNMKFSRMNWIRCAKVAPRNTQFLNNSLRFHLFLNWLTALYKDFYVTQSTWFRVYHSVFFSKENVNITVQ